MELIPEEGWRCQPKIEICRVGIAEVMNFHVGLYPEYRQDKCSRISGI